MKYSFVCLKNSDGGSLYMEPREYDRYSGYDVFKNGVQGLCIYENMYIAAFPLMFNFEEIVKYNPDCKLVDYVASTDICFNKKSYSQVSKDLGCEN